MGLGVMGFGCSPSIGGRSRRTIFLSSPDVRSAYIGASIPVSGVNGHMHTSGDPSTGAPPHSIKMAGISHLSQYRLSGIIAMTITPPPPTAIHRRLDRRVFLHKGCVLISKSFPIIQYPSAIVYKVLGNIEVQPRRGQQSIKQVNVARSQTAILENLPYEKRHFNYHRRGLHISPKPKLKMTECQRWHTWVLGRRDPRKY